MVEQNALAAAVLDVRLGRATVAPVARELAERGPPFYSIPAKWKTTRPLRSGRTISACPSRRGLQPFWLPLLICWSIQVRDSLEMSLTEPVLMPALGQKRKSRLAGRMSASPPQSGTSLSVVPMSAKCHQECLATMHSGPKPAKMHLLEASAVRDLIRKRDLS